MSRAFGVTLHEAHSEGRAFRHRQGPITLPQSIAPLIVGVLGLDNRPQSTPRYLVRPEGVAGPRAAAGALTPLQVASLYNFPSGDGSGQTIAIIEFGGGFSQADLTHYFTGLGVPVPSITAVPVMGASNNPGVDPNADGEVALDIEVAGVVAPRELANGSISRRTRTPDGWRRLTRRFRTDLSRFRSAGVTPNPNGPRRRCKIWRVHSRMPQTLAFR